jgi:protein-disulfide isomerase
MQDWFHRLKEMRVRAMVALPVALALVAGAAVVGAQTSGGGGVMDRAAVEKIVREYILAHPEIIPEAMNGMQAREVRKLLADNRKEIETPFAGAVAGNPKGDVSVVVFFDYACPYCRQGHADTQKLVESDKNVRIVYRDFPVLSPASEEAAMVSLSAAQQGRYERFHNAMFETPGKVSHERTVAMVRTAGLDELRTAKDLNSQALRTEIKRNIDLGRALGLTGTPSYVVGNRILSGAVGYEALKEAVAEARQDKAA